MFGEETVLKDAVAPFSARSMTYSDINTLDRTILWEIIEGFPDLKHRIHVESIRHVSCTTFLQSGLTDFGLLHAISLQKSQVKVGIQVFREEILAYTKAYMNLLRELKGILKPGEGK